ncbi:MAG: crossover junction endodeoxyribonuclease RuvC [Verrucomicrobiota bacterium]|nr:crossover junction endodeoxyribonuclease RuvC [Verrucomicrobiota bacterium]
MSTPNNRTLGIDTSLRSTGVAVVEWMAGRYAVVECGVLKNHRNLPVSECLMLLSRGLGNLIARTRPAAVAIEGVFYHENARTAVTLGQARGVAIAACAEKGIPIFEYEPRRVKQAVVGRGEAGKEQLRRMVMTLLNIEKAPPEDASDALALAVCHLHNRTGYAALMPKPI